MQSIKTLSDKVALITGAGKGAGRTLAQTLAAHGALVAANDISPINVENVVGQIRLNGGQATAYVDDIAKKVGAQALVNQVEDDFGKIDILINHAAVEPVFPLLDMDEWDWHRTLDVNLTGAFLMSQSVGRLMRAQGWGTIIHLITGAGAGSGEQRSAYFASMAGLLAFSHHAQQELAPYNVHVHAVETEKVDVVEIVLDLCRRQG